MLQNFFSNIRWQDWVDIFMLTVIIYRLLLMLKGTRTVQILIGFLFVSLSFYAAEYFQIKGVTWVLTNLFNSLVVVIIVLFQSDFRNALAQVGTQKFFRDYSFRKSLYFIEELYKTCEHFSKNGTGALVVLEQDMGLGAYSTNATEINAKFSPQLLVAIFNTHAPLHDGAVIIDGSQQIAYAGCILPLSANINLAEKYGTRHRAALGLSEESDAIVLIVSEETGVISMAVNGKMYEENENFSVKKKLNELLNKS
ncbi:MAG: TIGR00159 family protein [Deltaproteobacteria bacterium]|jgi:diadenylate cyclase|nr:TIGR00159 family protein [Deltaproteobacteria bacterium]